MRPKSHLSSFLPAFLLAASASWSSAALADPTPEVIANFDAAALEVPENIAIDYLGYIYVSLALTGEIARIGPDGTTEVIASLPIVPFQECFGFINGQTGLTYTPWGLYVNVNACDPDDRGIWWVSPVTGATAKITSLPPDAFANGLARRYNHLYASDSFSGRIFRVPMWGGPATVWVEDPLLDPAPDAAVPVAANGVKFFDDELYVSNSTTGDIVAFEILPNQSVGASRIHATLDTPCDDFAFDAYGTIYCGTNPVNSVVAIWPDGETEVVLSGDELLDGPSAMTFGRLWDDHTLYITNAAFPFYPNHGSPSVVAIELDVPGYPFQ